MLLQGRLWKLCPSDDTHYTFLGGNLLRKFYFSQVLLQEVPLYMLVGTSVLLSVLILFFVLQLVRVL
jgi:hypothetical protein